MILKTIKGIKAVDGILHDALIHFKGGFLVFGIFWIFINFSEFL